LRCLYSLCFFPSHLRRSPSSILFPYTTLFRSGWVWLMMRPTHDTTTTSKRIVVTTNAQAQIFNKLDIPLVGVPTPGDQQSLPKQDRKSTRLNSSHVSISYAVFCLKKKKKLIIQ